MNETRTRGGGSGVDVAAPAGAALASGGAALTTGAVLAPGGAGLMFGGGALNDLLDIGFGAGSKMMVSTLLPLLGASVRYARVGAALVGGRWNPGETKVGW